jgi:hypothetical protein
MTGLPRKPGGGAAMTRGKSLVTTPVESECLMIFSMAYRSFPE